MRDKKELMELSCRHAGLSRTEINSLMNNPSLAENRAKVLNITGTYPGADITTEGLLELFATTFDKWPPPPESRTDVYHLDGLNWEMESVENVQRTKYLRMRARVPKSVLEEALSLVDCNDFDSAATFLARLGTKLKLLMADRLRDRLDIVDPDDMNIMDTDDIEDEEAAVEHGSPHVRAFLTELMVSLRKVLIDAPGEAGDFIRSHKDELLEDDDESVEDSDDHDEDDDRDEDEDEDRS
jgi:hypothetical protein